MALFSELPDAVCNFIQQNCIPRLSHKKGEKFTLLKNLLNTIWYLHEKCFHFVLLKKVNKVQFIVPALLLILIESKAQSENEIKSGQAFSVSSITLSINTVPKDIDNPYMHSGSSGLSTLSVYDVSFKEKSFSWSGGISFLKGNQEFEINAIFTNVRVETGPITEFIDLVTKQTLTREHSKNRNDISFVLGSNFRNNSTRFIFSYGFGLISNFYGIYNIVEKGTTTDSTGNVSYYSKVIRQLPFGWSVGFDCFMGVSYMIVKNSFSFNIETNFAYLYYRNKGLTNEREETTSGTREYSIPINYSKIGFSDVTGSFGITYYFNH